MKAQKKSSVRIIALFPRAHHLPAFHGLEERVGDEVRFFLGVFLGFLTSRFRYPKPVLPVKNP
jgi:hypothetical protein